MATLYSVQAGTRSLVGVLDASLGFSIDEADRYLVEMRAHFVHTEPNQHKFLATPVFDCSS